MKIRIYAAPAVKGLGVNARHFSVGGVDTKPWGCYNWTYIETGAAHADLQVYDKINCLSMELIHISMPEIASLHVLVQ